MADGDEVVKPQLRDGIVDGTELADIIDAFYAGDPHGDMIDNGDAILPGEAPQDDIVHAGGGDDLVRSGEGNDEVHAGDGNDTVYGGSGHDVLIGGDGDDYLDGGAGYDVMVGGEGNDTLVGGASGPDDGADNMYGDKGDDLFIDVGEGDLVYGGEDNDDGDIDVLDLRGSADAVNPGGSLTVEYDPNDPESGIVHFFDADGKETGTAEFHEIEKVIPCFTTGTLIATARGERKVEDLEVGDRVITRDNGIQSIRWIGKRALGTREMTRAPHLRPVLIREGALGNGLPERDMMVSPNHRVLIASEKTALYFEEPEVLVAAKHLVDMDRIDQTDVAEVAYYHFMFDQHEVVLSDGAWTESFQPGELTLRGIGEEQRNEIFELFPELQTEEGLNAYQSARTSLKKHEARLLVH